MANLERFSTLRKSISKYFSSSEKPITHRESQLRRISDLFSEYNSFKYFFSEGHIRKPDDKIWIKRWKNNIKEFLFILLFTNFFIFSPCINFSSLSRLLIPSLIYYFALSAFINFVVKFIKIDIRLYLLIIEAFVLFFRFNRFWYCSNPTSYICSMEFYAWNITQSFLIKQCKTYFENKKLTLYYLIIASSTFTLIYFSINLTNLYKIILKSSILVIFDLLLNSSSILSIESAYDEVDYLSLSLFLRNQLQLLGNISEGYVFLIASDFRCIWLSPNCKELLGESQVQSPNLEVIPTFNESLLKKGNLLEYIHHDDLEIFLQAFKNTNLDHKKYSSSESNSEIKPKFLAIRVKKCNKEVENGDSKRFKFEVSEEILFCDAAISVYKHNPKIYLCSMKDRTKQLRSNLAMCTLLDELSETFKTAVWGLNFPYAKLDHGENEILSKLGLGDFGVLNAEKLTDGWIASKALEYLTTRTLSFSKTRLDSNNASSFDNDDQFSSSSSRTLEEKDLGFSDNIVHDRNYNWVQYIFGEDRKKLEKAIERLVQKDDPFEFNIRYERPDGTMRWIKTAGFSVQSPIKFYWGMFQDITSDKKQNYILDSRVSRAERLLHASYDGWGIADIQDGIIIEGSEGLDEILGKNTKFLPMNSFLPDMVINCLIKGGKCRAVPIKYGGGIEEGERRKSCEGQLTACLDIEDSTNVIFGVSKTGRIFTGYLNNNTPHPKSHSNDSLPANFNTNTFKEIHDKVSNTNIIKVKSRSENVIEESNL